MDSTSAGIGPVTCLFIVFFLFREISAACVYPFPASVENGRGLVTIDEHVVGELAVSSRSVCVRLRPPGPSEMLDYAQSDENGFGKNGLIRH